MLSDGNEVVRSGEGRKRGFHSQNAVFTQRGFDGFGVGAFGKKELSVVFPVDGLAFSLLLVLGVNLVNIKYD